MLLPSSGDIHHRRAMAASPTRVPWAGSIAYEACPLGANLQRVPSGGTNCNAQGTGYQVQLAAQEVARLLDLLLLNFRRLHHVDSRRYLHHSPS